MDVEHIVATDIFAHLANGFQVGFALDIADRASDLYDDHIAVRAAGYGVDTVFDLVGDVGDDLDGAAEILAAAFFADDRIIDLAGGYVIGLVGGFVGEAFVVAEVEVGFGAVVGHEDLTMLVRGHSTRVDVNVGVKFHE